MAKNQEVEIVQLRNINSGALVSVVPEKVVRMGSEWEPADGPARTAAKKVAPAKKAAARKTAAKKSASVVTTETVSPDTDSDDR